LWAPVLRGEEVDWEDVFAGYVAQVDFPGAAFWRELSVVFPEALVVLSTCDGEDWYRSAASTIFQLDSESRALRDRGRDKQYREVATALRPVRLARTAPHVSQNVWHEPREQAPQTAESRAHRGADQAPRPRRRRPHQALRRPRHSHRRHLLTASTTDTRSASIILRGMPRITRVTALRGWAARPLARRRDHVSTAALLVS
jgi:hypothetical protein